MDSEQTGASPFFAALAEPTRLRLVQALARQSAEQPLCVHALAECLGVSQPAVSQHLRVLRNLGIVRAERRGPRVHYFLDQARFLQWSKAARDALNLPGARSEPSGCKPDPGCGH
jgi:DNA-binding transcriptional ArsR family regulator